MLRRQRYTVPFPDPVFPPPDRYDDAYASLPFLRRLILRLAARLRRRSQAEMTRLFLIARLREQLNAHWSDFVDAGRRELTQRFSDRLRAIGALCDQVTPLIETVVRDDGGFLRYANRRINPDHFRRVATAGEPTEELVRQMTMDTADVAQASGDAAAEALEREKATIFQDLERVWRSIRTTQVLVGFPFTALTIDPRHPVTAIPIVPNRQTLFRLLQVLLTFQTFVDPAALDLAREYAAGKVRIPSETFVALHNGINATLRSVPLLDVVRLAVEQPLLTVAPVKIRLKWWEPFEREWRMYVRDRVPSNVLRRRFFSVRTYVAETYGVESVDNTRFPRDLYPRTLSVIEMLLTSGEFTGERKAVTHVVIDARFHRLDLRNELHQALLQLDHALEHVRLLIGTTTERGSIAEEEERIERNAASPGISRRRIVSAHNRFRALIMTDVRAIAANLKTCGEIVAMGLHAARDSTPPFELERRTVPPELHNSANTWPALADNVSGLFESEEYLRAYRRS